MDRSLWRILLAIFFVAFAVQRAVLVVSLDFEPVLAIALLLQTGFGLLAAAGLWMGHRFALAAILAVGISVGATTLYGAFVLGGRGLPLAISQLLVAALATGALVVLMSREAWKR